MSDLHLEFSGGKMKVPEKKGDILVLAGDINIGTNSIEFLDECASTFNDVILVLGNHEFYHNDISVLYQEFRKHLAPNCHLLQNEWIRIRDKVFVGTTLWADMLNQAFYGMNDSNYIKNGDVLFNYNDVLLEYQKAINFLSSVKDTADVIITHHAPSIQSINLSRYGEGNILNTGYYTELLPDFEGSKVKTWIHGHTHHCVDYKRYGIRVVSNQRGYVNYEEVFDFDPNKVVEV